LKYLKNIKKMFLLTKFVNCVLFNPTFNKIQPLIKIRRWEMKKGIVFKTFIYFLSISLLLLVNGFHSIVAEAKERVIPIGEMISKGEVNFEVRENVWKKVDSSHFPLFQGVKIKTEKGVAAIALGNNSHVEVGQNSLLSFDQNDRLHLFQGQINFRISPTAELNFKIGKLTVTKSHSLQASKGSRVASPKNEETIGSISIHSNGAVTIKSIQGPLFILDQERTVLATISSQDSVTIPSPTVKDPSKAMVAQAGETGKSSSGKEEKESGGFVLFGMDGTTWGWIAGGVFGLGGSAALVGTIISSEKGPDYFIFCIP
jgi:hypothetical protein